MSLPQGGRRSPISDQLFNGSIIKCQIKLQQYFNGNPHSVKISPAKEGVGECPFQCNVHDRTSPSTLKM